MRNTLLKTLYALVVSVLALVWFMHASLNTYWEQTEHRDALLASAQAQDWWHAGAVLQGAANASVATWRSELAEFDRKLVTTVNVVWFNQPLPDAAAPDETDSVETVPSPVPARKAAKPVTTALTIRKPAPAHAGSVATVAPAVARFWVDLGHLVQRVGVPADEVVLHPGDKVFFVGDSMMQGVAPHVRRTLYRKYHIRSIDLSKESTGLSYPGFFNWPKTVRDTFAQHPDIRLMVVFLGPNDPWDFPIKRGEPYAKFESPAWEAEYRRRVELLLSAARAHHARVIWLQVPYMRSHKLNRQVAYLDTIYQSEAAKAHAIYLTVDDALGYTKPQFSYYTNIDGRRHKVRIDDGIHFTIRGQKLIAKRVLAHIHVTTNK